MTHGGDPLRISEKSRRHLRMEKAKGTCRQRERHKTGQGKAVFSSPKQASLNLNRVKSIL